MFKSLRDPQATHTIGKDMIKNIPLPTASMLIFTALISLYTSLALSVFSKDEIRDNDTVDTTKPMVSIETYTNTKHVSADSLGFAANYATRNGNNIDQAIALCRRSLEKNNDDIDVHLTYAQLLEEKFINQGENDATLYLDCIKEWLSILRNEIGDERNLTFRGVGLPFTGYLFKDDDRAILAKNHLLTLTGIEPKGWETDNKYLQKVSKRSTVKGKLLAEGLHNKKPQ